MFINFTLVQSTHKCLFSSQKRYPYNQPEKNNELWKLFPLPFHGRFSDKIRKFKCPF